MPRSYHADARLVPQPGDYSVYCMPGIPNITSTPSFTSDLAKASPPLILTMSIDRPRSDRWLCIPAQKSGQLPESPILHLIYQTTNALPQPLTVTLAYVVIGAMNIQPFRGQGSTSLVVDRPVQQLDICDTFAMVSDISGC